MNKILIFSIGFAAGLVSSAIIFKIIQKKREERLIEDPFDDLEKNVDPVEDAIKKQNDPFYKFEKHTNTAAEALKKEEEAFKSFTKKMNDYKDIITNSGYEGPVFAPEDLGKLPLTHSDEDGASFDFDNIQPDEQVYQIDVDEVGEEKNFQTKVLTYFSDHVLADEGMHILKIEDVCGQLDLLEMFEMLGPTDPAEVYVRNRILSTDYIIEWSDDSYSDMIE